LAQHSVTVQNTQETTRTIAPASANRAQVFADYDVLQRGAGACALFERKLIRVLGDDRVPFLHGMCSNDIKNARSGAIVPALFLTEHAHLIAEFFAWIDDASILIEIDQAAWSQAREHLEKLLVADDVEFEDCPDLVVVDVEGPRAAEAIRATTKDVVVPEKWRWTRTGEISIGNLPRFGASAGTILAPRQRVADVLSSIESLGADFRRISTDAIEIVRVENGIARVGVDSTDKTIALEARLNRAISVDKGCYVGQETIERATARGGIKKKLYGLVIEGERVPALNVSARFEGKEVGRLSSVEVSPRLGVIGLAILNHSVWKPGTRLTIADIAGELEAEVSDIPFPQGLK
jgi:folate-binding protein YgfZ